jgi:diguanylate cyclase (GGDEF)-like protein
MVDIDWFKRVNDRNGHLAGDNVLRTVAATIQKSIRTGDLCGRIGGDEFGLLFSHATLAQAEVIAERIRVELINHAFVQLGIDSPIGVSIGLAPLSQTESIDTALAHADAALYQAKLLGRNRVVVAQEP